MMDCAGNIAVNPEKRWTARYVAGVNAILIKSLCGVATCLVLMIIGVGITWGDTPSRTRLMADVSDVGLPNLHEPSLRESF